MSALKAIYLTAVNPLDNFTKHLYLIYGIFTMKYDCIRIVWDYFQNRPKTYVSKEKKYHPTN